ncbi:MAG: 2-C-methyl-D-erythritol 4-phosphate cytidylyltransferase [Bacteroidales bacterium]
MLEKYVIIVAGGRGKRMYSQNPKQFMQIAGRPVLMHTIEKFSNYPEDFQIIVVLPAPYIDFWASLCRRFDFTVSHKIIEGGDSRFYSVKNGLQFINNNSLVGIHDGVRPLVSNTTIHNAFHVASSKGNAIPVVKISESIRQVDEENSSPVNRQHYRLIQTPQCFRSELILRAYDQEFQKSFSDDATVVEALGQKINLVEGNYENIKITRPVDLQFAEAFLR